MKINVLFMSTIEISMRKTSDFWEVLVIVHRENLSFFRDSSTHTQRLN